MNAAPQKLAPRGHAWEDGEIVPVLTQKDITAATIMCHLCEWAVGSEARIAAVKLVLGLERRPITWIAIDTGLSKQAIHRAVKEAREQLVTLRNEAGLLAGSPDFNNQNQHVQDTQTPI